MGQKVLEHPITREVSLVSIENSHSFLKRCDEKGTTIIQAGFRRNPTKEAYRDENNPVVILPSGEVRWYGEVACSGKHESSLLLSKEQTALASFYALLHPYDDGKDLTIISSHWDRDASEAIASNLKGTHSVIRNGTQITCNVVQVIPEIEGRGAFYLMREHLVPGDSLLIELGQGTAEEWVFDQQGRLIDGKATDYLSVSKLVEDIASDRRIRASLKTNEGNEQAVNTDLISRCLRGGKLGSLSEESWAKIRGEYVSDWLDTLSGYLLKNYSHNQNLVNVVLSGGGACLVQAHAPHLVRSPSNPSGLFWIPEDPATASVRGAYLFHKERLEK